MNLCLKRANRGEKSPKTNNSFIAPAPKIIYRNIRIQKAVGISTKQARNRTFIGLLFKKKSHKAVCTNVTCFYFLCLLS